MRDVQFDQIMAGERPATAADWGVEAEEFWGTVATAAGSRKVPSARGDYSDLYRGLHAAVAGEAELPVSLEAAIHNIAVLDAARLSDAEGRTGEVATA